MKKCCKQKIPNNIKNNVWLRSCKYGCDIRFTQCYTCDNFVMIPESIRKYHNINYDLLHIFVNQKIKHISGVGEFGHIISEKNGGTVYEDNLIVQCKYCNCKNGSFNIDIKSINIHDSIMIDYNEETDIEMGISNVTCCQILKNGVLCKNKCIFNRDKCHIHLEN